MRFAKPSSISAALLACLVGGVWFSAIGFALDRRGILGLGLVLSALAAGTLALHLIATERRRHERIEEALASQASFFEALVESISAIAATLDPDEILELTRREAERLFDAHAAMVGPGESRRRGAAENAVLVPLRVREAEVGTLRLARTRTFVRGDTARARVLADFAGRAIENAKLLAEAQVREAERARLSDQLLTAEQEERRRLALFLHDTAVQSLSGIALMLDAGLHSIGSGRLEEATTVISSALERHRETIRSLRDLSFQLEPVVLRDQGFAPAVSALAEQLGLERKIQIDLDVAAAEPLTEKAQAALYQIVREALHGAIRRGPPTRISVRVAEASDGGLQAVIADDAPGERRAHSYEGITERARALNGTLDIDAGEDGGTTLTVTFPRYVAQAD
ncbi:MAG: sensor histidine kinase [Gaiellaceae bacterium]